MTQFDAFCICLECSGGGLYTIANNYSSAAPPYIALGDWLLQLSLELIQPELPSPIWSSARSPLGTTGFDNSSTLPKLRIEERFHYFREKICKARIWDDCNGALFIRLTHESERCMEEIAVNCDRR